jgi:hypothetical protein
MTLRPHRLTLLSSVLSTPDTRLGQPTIASLSGHKREALDQNHLSSTSPPLLFFLQLALATLPLAHFSHQFHSLPSELPTVFIHNVEKKLGSRPEEGLKPI